MTRKRASPPELTDGDNRDDDRADNQVNSKHTLTPQQKQESPHRAVARPHTRDLAHYNPEAGLKAIAINEAAEQIFARAKDASGLFAAIERKITAQAEYIVWRDSVIPGSGRRSKKDCSSEIFLPEDDPGHLVAHRWRQRFCAKNNTDGPRTIIDPSKIAGALEEAGRHCQRICEQVKWGTVRGTEGTGEFERYTPAESIEAVRRALGEIDLDPASCSFAQKTVRARKFYTERDNALNLEWHGRVFLNPPYHRELAPKFIDKLIAEISAGRVTEAILLMNSCTDTGWFDRASQQASRVCFTLGRVKFVLPNGALTLPTQGQVFFYFGDNPETFDRVFRKVGTLMMRQFGAAA